MPTNATALRYDYQSNRRVQVGRALLASMLAALTFGISGGVAQVSTLTADSASDATYTFTLRPYGGEAYTLNYNEGATGTTTTKATGIAALINADGRVNGWVRASSSSAVVTITALQKGVAGSFTLADSDAKLTSADVTTAVDYDQIQFGCAVAYDSSDPTRVYNPKTARAVAKVMTVTPTNPTNDETYTLTIRCDTNGDGVQEVYTWTYKDAAATAQRWVEAFTAAVNTSMPANSIVATENNSVLTLTSEVAGLDFAVEATAMDDAGGAATGTVAVATGTANTPHSFAGVVQCQDYPEMQASSGAYSAYWDGNKGQQCPVILSGLVLVRLDDDVTSIAIGDPVAFRVDNSGAGEVFGSFRNAKSTTDTCTLPSTRARWVDGQVLTDASGLKCALLQLI